MVRFYVRGSVGFSVRQNCTDGSLLRCGRSDSGYRIPVELGQRGLSRKLSPILPSSLVTVNLPSKRSDFGSHLTSPSSQKSEYTENDDGLQNNYGRRKISNPKTPLAVAMCHFSNRRLESRSRGLQFGTLNTPTRASPVVKSLLPSRHIDGPLPTISVH